MTKQLKFLIPALVLTAMLISGIGFTLSLNSAVSAAAPSVNYQDNGSALYCDPDNCPANNGEACPGGGPANTGGFTNCHGQSLVSGKSSGCPCGGPRSAR